MIFAGYITANLPHMKKILFATLMVLTFAGCGNEKQDEKTLLDSVIKIHDKVMSNDERLMKNKMTVDTLLKTKLTVADTAAVKAMLMGLNIQLTDAEDSMEKWMEKFDPEKKDKSHQDYMNYLGDQKNKIAGIDSAMNAAITASTKYMQQVNQ